MTGYFLLPDGSATHQVGDQRMVLRELMQLAGPINVGAAITDMHDAELRTELKRHCQRRPHAFQLRILSRLLQDRGVSLAQGRLELRQHFLRAGIIGREEPPEGIERELLDRGDRDCARAFARSMTAHTVGDEKQVRAIVADL